VRRTRRTLCVLDAIAELGERGFGPSNREIADAVGISELKAHPHQMSRIPCRGACCCVSGHRIVTFVRGLLHLWR